MRIARRPACVAVAVAFSALGAVDPAAAVPAAGTLSPTFTKMLGATADAYVDSAAPSRANGGLDKLVAAAAATSSKTTYVKFAVPTTPAGTTLVSAKLVARTLRSTGTTVQLRTVDSSTWSERTVTYRTRPATGTVHASAAVSASDATATFDVTRLVRGGTTASYALTAPSGLHAFASRESGTGGPRLLLTYKRAEPLPPTPPPAPPTKFGMSIAPKAGESAAQAVDRLRTQFGGMPVARVFSTGLMPATWNDNATLKALGSGSAVVYSFKGDMAAAAAGAYDARLQAFLASRPAGLKVWVALHHEPEDDVERGAFTAAQFRAATAHLAPVIRRAGGIPTTILMQYTLSPGSGRDWHDYYSPAIDVIAWDGYNTQARDSRPSYKSAQNYVAPVLAVAKETGKKIGWAELGSPCITTDPTCAGRAAWLTSLTQAFSDAGAQFATYWNRPDFGDGFDYSLTDALSVNAWKAGMRAS